MKREQVVLSGGEMILNLIKSVIFFLNVFLFHIDAKMRPLRKMKKKGGENRQSSDYLVMGGWV